MRKLIVGSFVYIPLIALVLPTQAAISEPDPTTLVPIASAAPSSSASEGPKLQKGCDPTMTCKLPWTRRFSIGPGLTSVSARFDGKIGLVDKIVPLEISYSAIQRTFPQLMSSGQYGDPLRITFWRIALGLTASKPAEGSDVVFGAYVQPWGIQIDRFAIGLGIAYQTVGKLESDTSKWSFVIPFSYAIAI